MIAIYEKIQTPPSAALARRAPERVGDSIPPFILGLTGSVHGAGSSTVARLTADILGYNYEYAGRYMRRMAVKLGYATSLQDEAGIITFSALAGENEEINRRVDSRILDKATQANSVVDGKVAAILIKAHRKPDKKSGEMHPIASPYNAFTVLITCDPLVGAKRALVRKKMEHSQTIPGSSERKEEEERIMKSLTEEEIDTHLQLVTQRMGITQKIWDKLYGLDTVRQSAGKFDLILDSTSTPPREIVRHIFEYLRLTPEIWNTQVPEDTKQKIQDYLASI